MLLNLGADIDVMQGDNWSALERAVQNNRIEIARVLIQRGANVNYVDRFGYTPLLLAASIDFGDTEMIELLLRSGAHTESRNKAGETALDLARKYGHTHLIGRLAQAATSR
jgi:ankyrin repeat protein